MKQYCLLLLCVIAFGCCKKQTIKPVTPSFVLLTKIDGETFHPGDQVTIKWKATGYPAGAVISAVLLHSAPRLGVEGQDLAVDQTVRTSGNSGTPNDGEAVYTFPADTDQFYSFAGIPYGNNFQIYFLVQSPASNSEWQPDTARAIKTNFFTIVPDGCTAAVGYSTTTGASCIVPQ